MTYLRKEMRTKEEEEEDKEDEGIQVNKRKIDLTYRRKEMTKEEEEEGKEAEGKEEKTD